MVVIDQSEFQEGFLKLGDSAPGSLDRLIDGLSRLRVRIPPEYREAARCEISACGGGEDVAYPRLEIYYERPETFEEAQEREACERSKTLFDEARERQTYERLKAKFEEKKL